MTIRWVKGILYKRGSVLIGRIRGKNNLISRMSWTFPFRQLEDDQSPRKQVKELFKDIGINAEIEKFLKKVSPSENPKIDQYYYRLNYRGGGPSVTEGFSKYTWVKPSKVLEYFSTSIDKDIIDYLRTLEEKGEAIDYY